MKRFQRRIVRGAILKSALAALIIACGVLLVTALASWIAGFRAGIWLALGLFAVSFAGSALLFYFLKYRPSAREVAREIDAIGLEERLITMMELEGDTSYLAKLQREDTEKALRTADHTLIKVAASVALCVAVGASAILGVGALTVDSLYVAGVIPSGVAYAASLEEEREFSCGYTVEKKGGKIYFLTEEGIGDEVKESISVTKGENAPAVIAVPDEGYVFTGWSDGLYDPVRQDEGVAKNIRVRATFAEVDALGDLLDDGQDGDGGDSDNSLPVDSEDAPPQDPQRPTNPANGSGDAHDNSNQQVNDGQTYYGDQYGDAYDDAMGRLGDGSNIPGDLQGGVSGYLDSIGKGGSEGGESGGGN